MAAAFTVGMVASIRATMDMAIPRTVTTATDRVQLAACNDAALARNQSSAGWAGLWIFNAHISSAYWPDPNTSVRIPLLELSLKLATTEAE
jgi:hypothetical protein